MSVKMVERCDCCRREVPILGSRSFTDNHDVHRRKVRRTSWRFFSSQLSWAPYEREWEVVCGDCWEAIGAAVASGSRLGTHDELVAKIDSIARDREFEPQTRLDGIQVAIRESAP